MGLIVWLLSIYQLLIRICVPTEVINFELFSAQIIGSWCALPTSSDKMEADKWIDKGCFS